MRIRNLLIAVAVLAMAVPGIANAEGGFKVTGGGQAFAGEPGQGPGDTFGFNAHDTDGDEGDAAKGNLNHIDRSDADEDGRNEGKGVHFKGDVTCLQALTAPDGSDGAARFGGVLRNVTTEEGDALFFTVDVTDNGEGNGNDDAIFFRTFSEDEIPDDGSPCDVDPENEEDFQLARGNVQIHNYEAPEEESSGASVPALLGL